MLKGQKIEELASQVIGMSAQRADYIVPMEKFRMEKDDPSGVSVILSENSGLSTVFSPTNIFHRQLSTFLKVPGPFYDRLQAYYPALLCDTVNTLRADSNGEKRMVRTVGPQARAFLSSRYRRLDNIDLLEYILPELIGKDLRIISCQLTEARLYIKFVSLNVEGEVKTGDLVSAGGVISNSEVGLGSVNVYPFILRKVCDNGAILNQLGQKKYHVGRNIPTLEDGAVELYASDTLKADDKAFWLKARDLVRATVEQVQFDKLLERMRESTNQKIEGKPEDVVVKLADRNLLNEDQRDSILRHLIDDGVGLSAYGLMNAVTSVAGEQTDYTESTRLEAIGGSIISLNKSQWQEIAA